MTRADGEKAVLEYDYGSGTAGDWQAQAISVCISMDGRDLSANSLYDGVTSFHGYAGFDGPDYRAQTFNELSKHSRIVVHLALSPELFENLTSLHGKLYGGDLVITDDNNNLEQKLISLDFYRLCVGAAYLAVLLAVLLVAIVLMHLRRVYGTSHGDELVLSEGSRKHWIRYMSSSLILSIALIGLVNLVSPLIPSPIGSTGSYFYVVVLCAILGLNAVFMLDGMTTLRNTLNKRKNTFYNADNIC